MIGAGVNNDRDLALVKKRYRQKIKNRSTLVLFAADAAICWTPGTKKSDITWAKSIMRARITNVTHTSYNQRHAASSPGCVVALVSYGHF